MTDRSHVDDLLSAYLDGELDVPEGQRVAAHVRSCDRCERELEALRELHARLRQTEIPDPGAAYWSGFATRVQERLAQGAMPARAPWVERVASWFAPADRIAWPRVAGAFAVVTMVTYVGMRGFGPQGLQRADRDATASLAGRATATTPPESVVVSPLAASRAARPPAGSTTIESERRRETVSAEREMANAAPVRIEAPPAGRAADSAASAGEVVAGGAKAAPGESETRRAAPLSLHPGAPPVEPAAPDRAGTVATPSTAPTVSAMRPVYDTVLERGTTAGVGVDATVHAFVAAALGGDTLQARQQRDALAVDAAAAPAVTLMDEWLQLSTAAALRVKGSAAGAPRAVESLSILDALVWPRREQPLFRVHVEELGRRLVQRAAEPPLRPRAVAYAEYLAVTAPEPKSRATWQATLESLSR